MFSYTANSNLQLPAENLCLPGFGHVLNYPISQQQFSYAQVPSGNGINMGFGVPNSLRQLSGLPPQPSNLAYMHTASNHQVQALFPKPVTHQQHPGPSLLPLCMRRVSLLTGPLRPASCYKSSLHSNTDLDLPSSLGDAESLLCKLWFTVFITVCPI